MVIKTDLQINNMIQKLEDERASLPEKSFFGDNNWKMLDAGITVLKAKLTENDLFDEHEEYESEICEEFAFTAARWLEGKAEDSELIEE